MSRVHGILAGVVMCLTVAALLLAPLVGGGCAIVAWFAEVTNPGPRIEAVHEIPCKSRVMVFVDMQDDAPHERPIVRPLTEDINRQLTEHEVAESVVPFESIEAASARTGNFIAMTPQAIGSELGADAVIHVVVKKYHLKEPDTAGMMWQGMLDMRVTVHYVADGTSWPELAEGHVLKPVEYTPRSQSSSEYYAAELVKILAAKGADRVAKLFYRHHGQSLASGDVR